MFGTNDVVDLYYRNADHVSVIRGAIIRNRDTHGVTFFAQQTKDHQWFPYESIIRMIAVEPSEADLMS